MSFCRKRLFTEQSGEGHTLKLQEVYPSELFAFVPAILQFLSSAALVWPQACEMLQSWLGLLPEQAQHGPHLPEKFMSDISYRDWT